jgi:phosphatidate cytidylyltransferase
MLPTEFFALALTFFVYVGACEWAALIGFKNRVEHHVYAALVSILLLPAYVLLSDDRVVWIWIIAALWWFSSIFLVFRYRGETGVSSSRRPFHFFLGIVLLVPTWTGLVFLHQQPDDGPWLVLFLMVLIWVADSGAFFVGRKFGKHKLAPFVSPGKTVEGAIGALIATGLYSTYGAYKFGYRGDEWVLMVVICAIIVVYSIVGDLVESLFKRRAGMKDSGTIFPGHGGVLDRIDSMTSAAPLFALAYWWLEYGW